MQREVSPKNPFHIVRRFDSFAEYLELCAQKNDLIDGGASHQPGRASWAGTKSFDDAMELARNGWQAGLALIDKLTAQLETMTGSLVQKQVVQWDVAGDFADAGLFSAGVPECMGSFHEEYAPGAGKVVRIGINGFYSAGFSAETVMKRGAATLALIDALESAGRSCELYMATAKTSRGVDKHVDVVPLKQAGEAVEMDRLAFICAHPSSFRRLGFSAAEMETPEVRERFGANGVNGFYGSPAKHSEPDTDIVIPEASFYQSKSESELLAWIKGELEKQGCTMEETPA